MNMDTVLLQLHTSLATAKPLHLPCELAQYERKAM